MTAPGSAGTASDGYRIPVKEGRHRAPPTPPPPDRFTAPIAAAAAILTAASLIALYAPGLAPDATAAGRHGVTVSTAARSARTVSVPLTVLPATPPTIGASGAWDPETDAPIQDNPLSAPRTSETFAGATGTATAPPTLSGELVATTTPLTTTRPPTTSTVDTATATRTTTSPSPTTDTAAASTTSSATPTEEPTVTPTSSAEPTPTDVIGDVVDQALEDAFGETP